MTLRSPSWSKDFPQLRRILFLSVSLSLVCLGNSFAFADGIAETQNEPPKVTFTRDIVPILADTCLACHGPDANTRKADLRLDDRQAAIDAGAIDPGSVSSSLLIDRIFSDDPESIMPPPDSHKVLTDAQKQTLQLWVEQGADYEKHWSFEAPVMPEVPQVSKPEWVRNPIDSFVLAKLDEQALTPSPEADLRSLIRRACLDLTGLPPTPEEIEKVLADPNPDRYERYVDCLLDRETWGEHRGRYWLDYARYADTHGIHFDNYREMYSYRDWVIRAFNDNMPFDQFTVEQLGGDMLPNATLDQQIATGFQRCNITTNEGGIIDEEYVVLYARDRVETTGAVWLGLTVGCAVCHDHKFDPISQREFYELSAFFNNTTQGPRDGNRKDTPPTVVVPRMEDRPRYTELKQQRHSLDGQIAARRDAAREPFTAWRTSQEAFAQIESSLAAASKASEAKLQFHVPAGEGNGRQIYFSDATPGVHSKTLTADPQRTPGAVAESAWVNQDALQVAWPEAGRFENTQPYSVALWIKPPANSPNGAVIARMDPNSEHRGWDVWLEGGRVAMHLINKWPENAAKVVSEAVLANDQWTHVTFTYDGTNKAEGFRCYLNGVPTKLTIAQNSLSSSTQTDVPFKLGGRHIGASTPGVAIQDIRLFDSIVSEQLVSTLSGDRQTLFLLSKDDAALTEEQRNGLFSYYLKRFDTEHQQLLASKSEVDAEIAQIESRGTQAHVMAERETKPLAYILNRGEYDQRRDEVYPETPAVLPAMADRFPPNRLGLAQWLVSDDHPLTARVTVNRCWQELFGRGIVATAGDFGTTGMLPSNQALLDYLAIDFRTNGWDLKQLYRQIVTSATYRQSPAVTPEKLEKDPENIYLSRGPRYRMDAEMVRDYALSVSGLLNPLIGGRSVRPYQPEGVWEAVAMPESDTRIYKQDEAPMLYRRSMYTFWKRAAPPASMDIFNAPAREVCTVRRERTNTPLQALVTMNDPQYIEAARVLAGKMIASGKFENDESQINALSLRILGREFAQEETQIVLQTLSSARAFYEANSEEAAALLAIGAAERNAEILPAEHAAWTLVLNQMMNLDEVLCK